MNVASTNKKTCANHRTTPAVFTCRTCRNARCQECVAPLQLMAGGEPIVGCTSCRGPVVPIQQLRSATPFMMRLPGAFTFLLTKDGLLQVGAIAFVMSVLSLGGLVGFILGQGILWTYIFSITQKTAMGRDPFGHTDTALLTDVLMPALRGNLVVLMFWAPAASYAYFVRDVSPVSAFEFQKPKAEAPPPLVAPRRTDATVDDDVAALAEGANALAGRTAEAEAALRGLAAKAFEPEAPKYSLRSDPLFWLLLILGLLWVPAGLMLAASGSPAFVILNPVAAIGNAGKLGFDYLVLCGAMLGLFVVSIVIAVFAGLLNLLPIPFVGGLISTSLGLYSPFVAGRMIGLLLYTRGYELGYLTEHDAYEPLPPSSLVPKGVMPEVHQSSVHTAEEAARLAKRFDPIEMAPDLSSPGGVQVLMDAVLKSEWPRAAQLFAQAPEFPPNLLETSALIEIGKAAAGVPDDATSVRAFEGAIARNDARHSPTAMVLLAKVHAERLDNAGRAAEIFTEVTKKYPGTQAAKYAEQRLAAQKS